MNETPSKLSESALVAGTARNDLQGTLWHTLTAGESGKVLEVDEKIGLTHEEAASRLKQFGDNTLAHAQQRTALAIFLAQFRSLLVLLLFVASVIALVMGENIEAGAILVVILLNAAIGFLTEWKAQQALSALQKQSVRVAHAVRDGNETEIPASELVPGDLVTIAAGERVPADGRIVECARLQVVEAALTGESLAVTKSSEPIAENDASLGDRLNMAFLGTTITDGRGRMLVTSTGARTEMGKIGMLIDEAITPETPLEQKLARLGRLLIVVVSVLCAVIVLAGWFRGLDDFWHMLEVGISLAIAAVPEGLPAVTTMTLALGMQRMARQRALVRRLPAVETLGSVTVICTDKTGTLTQNEMTVCVFVLNGAEVKVTGAGYTPTGTFELDGKEFAANSDERLSLALRIGSLCNDAKMDLANGEDAILGDPTEAALIVAAEKAGLNQTDLNREFPRIGEVPFDSTTKQMVTVHRTADDRKIAFVKGSPGNLLAASTSQVGLSGSVPLTDEDRRRWEESNVKMAGEALRVLGLAYRELLGEVADEELTRELTFVGLVGMSDPLREQALSAITTCRQAGIRTVMITGDQQATAAEIARQLGIDHDLNGKPLRVVHGRELTNLDAASWQKMVNEAAVFARVSPEHKLQIVEALQQQKQVVAMTGDGVNDAPALKKADIGIAMGMSGTDVAKENADLVITDDNFASIVSAVEQGRVIYGNIQRFLHYLLSCNFSEIMTVFFALMIGWPLPLAALQILWLNLITDVFPAFALALEPSAPDVMKRPPRDPEEALLSPRFIGLLVWQGMMLTGVTLLAFGIGMSWHGIDKNGSGSATTIAFMTLALSQVFHVFNARSQHRSAFTGRLFTNGWLWFAVVICIILQFSAVYLPLLQKVLHTVNLTVPDLGLIVVCSLLPVAVVEVVKLIQRLATRPEQT